MTIKHKRQHWTDEQLLHLKKKLDQFKYDNACLDHPNAESSMRNKGDK